ncbi:MAG TPA: two-component regulator propeller domain-containing protein [Azospirillaceae bacterium]|nr:two-component regulator propeller domain-containing protein [Azospirillaceae bacterium]
MLAALLAVLPCAVPAGPARADTGMDAGGPWDRLSDRLFDRIDRDEGLPSDIVTALVEDATGFIWVGTTVGLSRYDGHGFKVYLPDPADPSSLPDGYVNGLHVDARGRLWVATNNGGLARYVPETDGFVRYPAGPDGLGHPSVYAMADAEGGDLWVALRSGLDRLDPGTGEAVHEKTGPGGTGLPDAPVQALLEDGKGALWVATTAGLYVRAAGSERFANAAALPGLAALGEDTAVLDLYEDGAGRVWIGTRDGRMLGYAPGDATLSSFDLGPGRPQIRAMVEAAPGVLWVASDPGGLIEVEVATGRRHPIRHDPSVPSSVGGNAPRSLLRDRAGLLWVGTWGSGLSRHNPRNRAVLTLFASPNRPEGLSEGQVRSVMAGRDGRVWLGTETRGIDIFDPASGARRTLPPQPQGGGLPAAAVMGMAEDAAGRVWIGTQLGLVRVDPGGEPVPVPLPLEDPFPQVFRILAQGDTLWLASDGLVRLDTATGEARRYAHSLADRESLVDDRVRTLAPAEGGRLWVGTHRGLHLFDPGTGKAQRIQSNPFDPRSLSHNYVTSMLHDARGRLWVGTLGGGISILDRMEADGRPRFRRLDRRDGLPADGVAALERDAQGRIWAYTEDGLAVVDPDSLEVRTLDADDGVAIRGPWIGASAALPDGQLLFGGRLGLTVARPSLLAEWDYAPPLVVTEARVGGRPVPVGRFNGARPPDPLVVGPADAGFDVSFAALDYAAPGRPRYAYRLEGFDRDWHEVDAARRTAAYTNLSPGDYRLVLRASNKEGRWSEGVLTVPVRVLPAWHQTLWARGAAVAAALAGVAGLVQVRTAVLRRRKQQLEEEVAERTRELMAANEKLERLASLDPLTGILNRRRFMELAAVEHERARRYRHTFSLVMLDLDHFKRVNDTFGHAAGDDAIRAAAARVEAAIRKTDVAARYGGEELILLLPETPAEEAEVVAERIRRSIMVEPVRHEELRFPITASLGVAEWSDPAEPLAALIERADAALYLAKQAGRNRTEVARPSPAMAV